MNPLIQNTKSFQPNGIESLKNIFSMLSSGNPEQIAENLIQKNPQFRQFMESNRGKTPSQVAQENGIDLNQMMKLFK